jgi:hypothetical protein
LLGMALLYENNYTHPLIWFIGYTGLHNTDEGSSCTRQIIEYLFDLKNRVLALTT